MHPAYLETHFIAADGPQDWPEQFAIITAYATTGEALTDDKTRLPIKLWKPNNGSRSRKEIGSTAGRLG
jgi:hypothetical protein